MKKRRIAAATAAASALVATALAVPISANAAGASPAAVPNSQPSWAAHTASTGAASGAAAVNARVYLAPRGGLAGLAAAAQAMATKGSASYRHFLTHAQYLAQYAPTATEVKATEAYLSSQGLHVGSVAADNRYLAVSGTVAAANKAFGTTIKNYRHSGQSVQAPATALKVPASLSPAILSVTGLDTTAVSMTPTWVTPPAGYRNARPCSTSFGQLKASTQADFVTPLPKFANQTLSYVPCGYTGPQLRSAYEGKTALNGSGVTVAITDAYISNTLAKDANQYAELNGDGSYATGQFTATKAAAFTHQAVCGPSGWSAEQSLDVEAVHAMAPGANIRYYGAASCEDSDLLDALAAVVSDDKAQLVSDSWASAAGAESSANIAAYESVFLQGAVQGISFMFSSGDNGDLLATTGIKQVMYPAADPYVTGVGGTSTEIGANATLGTQYGWGTVKYTLSADGTQWANPTFVYGAGGGVSAQFNRPAYQNGVSASPYRAVPDVAMDADPNTGMLIGLTQTFPEGVHYDQFREGGTSLASPLFAGMTALSIQNAGSPVGLLNPTIYSNISSFTDVRGTNASPGDVRADFANGLDASAGINYSVRTFGQDSSLQVKNGYDEVTGVGSPNSGWLTALGSGS